MQIDAKKLSRSVRLSPFLCRNSSEVIFACDWRVACNSRDCPGVFGTKSKHTRAKVGRIIASKGNKIAASKRGKASEKFRVCISAGRFASRTSPVHTAGALHAHIPTSPRIFSLAFRACAPRCVRSLYVTIFPDRWSTACSFAGHVLASRDSQWVTCEKNYEETRSINSRPCDSMCAPSSGTLTSKLTLGLTVDLAVHHRNVYPFEPYNIISESEVSWNLACCSKDCHRNNK